MKCTCYVYTLKPHFYTVKLGFAWVYLIFLILIQNIHCGYSLEPPQQGGSNVYPPGVQLLGSRAKNFALGAQESPWGAPRATKTSPANFCNFFKSFTCVNKWVIKRCLVQSTGTLSLPVNTSNSWQLVC